MQSLLMLTYKYICWIISFHEKTEKNWEFHVTVILIWIKTEEKWIDRCVGIVLGFSHTKVDISWLLCKKLKIFDLKLIREIKQKIITQFAEIE